MARGDQHHREGSGSGPAAKGEATRNAILEYLAENGTASRDEIADYMEAFYETSFHRTRVLLAEMTDAGLLNSEGGEGRRQTSYTVADEYSPDYHDVPDYGDTGE